MKREIRSLMLMLLAVLMVSCIGTDKKTEENAYHRITAEVARSMMDTEDVIIVDVRRPDEYQSGHIPGAILIPNESIGSTEPEELPDKDATILIYCRSGRRSREASMKLVDLGYGHIYDFGGIIDWPYGIER